MDNRTNPTGSPHLNSPPDHVGDNLSSTSRAPVAPAPTIAFGDEEYRNPQDPRLKRFKAMALGLARLRGRHAPPNVDTARRVARDLMLCKPVLSDDAAVIEASFNELLCWVSYVSLSRRERMIVEVLEAEREERAERDGGRARCL